MGTYNIGGNGSVVVNNYITIGRIGGISLNLSGGQAAQRIARIFRQKDCPFLH